MTTIRKTIGHKAVRRLAALAVMGVVSSLVAGCAPRSNDFLSNIHPDSIGRSGESVD